MDNVTSLPPLASELLATLKIGGTLCAETDKSDEGIRNGGFRYWIEPTGERVDAGAARTLVALGLVRVVMGGLLPCCPGQQWAA